MWGFILQSSSDVNKSRRQYPTKHQLYGHLPPITKTIQVRRTRHAGHSWRSRDELISNVLLWTPTYGQAKAGRPARTDIQQLCKDMGYSLEDLPELMYDWEKWRERVRDIHASGTTWGWWFICFGKKSDMIVERNISSVDGDIRFINSDFSFWYVLDSSFWALLIFCTWYS